jgi:hypothetical protein
MRRFVLVVSILGLGLLPAVAVGSGTAVKTLKASLTGSAEAPDPGAPSGTGTATLTLNNTTGRVCWTFSALKNLAGTPNSAHIHKGKAGKAGPVLVPLGAAYKRQGCTMASVTLVQQILAHPGRYYVNVHNARYPGGAARGQLKTP